MRATRKNTAAVPGTIWGFGRLPKNTLMQYPSGRWGFVGSVDARLAYEEQDGSPVSDERIEKARHCGPGLLKLKTRTWQTREDALHAAQMIGAEVTL